MSERPWAAAGLVARREIVERGREKSFAIGMAITLAVIVAVIVVPKLFGVGDPSRYTVGFEGGQSGPAAQAALAMAGPAGFELTVDDTSGADAVQLVRDGSLDAAVTSQAVVVDTSLDPALGQVLQAAHQQVTVRENLAQAGLTEAQIAQAQDVPLLQVQELQPSDPSQDARRNIVFIGTFILYGQIIAFGLWVANGVVEEKSSRVIEVLLAAIRPRTLLTGKIVGIGLLGLAQLLVYAVVGGGLAIALGVLVVDASVISAVALLVGWFILGYAFYSCVFAAAGARVSRQEDLQNAIGPATVLLVASFVLAISAIQSDDAWWARVLAVVPPFSALVAPTRMVSGDAPAWEPVLSIALMLAAIVGMVLWAARIYENAVLRTGAPVSWRQAWGRRA